MGEGNQSRRRWLWIVLAGIVTLPVAVVIGLGVLFKLNEIPAEKRQPPPGVLTARADSTGEARPRPAAGPTPIARPQSYEESLIGRADPEAVEIFNRIVTTYQPDGFGEALDAAFPRSWQWGMPMSEDQNRWLLAQQELIEELIALARAGGVPSMSFEETRELLLSGEFDIYEMWQIPPVPNFLMYQQITRVLALEALRRQAAGDPAGAAEALLAIGPLTQSVKEPTVIGHLIGLAMQTVAMRSAAQWLETNPPPPEIARLLREQLGQNMLTCENLRLGLELEYICSRTGSVELLNGPFLQLLRTNIDLRAWDEDAQMNRNHGAVLFRRLLDQPYNTVVSGVPATWQSIVMKARATPLLDEFDQRWAEYLVTVGEAEPIDAEYEASGNVLLDLPMPTFYGALTRTLANQARTCLVLAGLDRVLGRGGAVEDPFTGEPLQTIEEPGARVIYSLGPDGEDQRAAVSYDPTNGTFSAGDIFIRMRR